MLGQWFLKLRWHHQEGPLNKIARLYPRVSRSSGLGEAKNVHLWTTSQAGGLHAENTRLCVCLEKFYHISAKSIFYSDFWSSSLWWHSWSLLFLSPSIGVGGVQLPCHQFSLLWWPLRMCLCTWEGVKWIHNRWTLWIKLGFSMGNWRGSCDSLSTRTALVPERKGCFLLPFPFWGLDLASQVQTASQTGSVWCG